MCPGAVDTGLVETIDIVGVDRDTLDAAKVKDRFRKRAIKPEQAAAAILRGIERNQYLVFTSRDIRIGYWFQRKFAPPYELVMRKLNDQLDRLAKLQQERSAR